MIIRKLYRRFLLSRMLNTGAYTELRQELYMRTNRRHRPEAVGFIIPHEKYREMFLEEIHNLSRELDTSAGYYMCIVAGRVHSPLLPVLNRMFMNGALYVKDSPARKNRQSFLNEWINLIEMKK